MLWDLPLQGLALEGWSISNLQVHGHMAGNTPAHTTHNVVARHDKPTNCCMADFTFKIYMTKT